MKRIKIELYRLYLADLYSKESNSTVDPEQIKIAYTKSSQQFQFCYEPLNKLVTLAGGESFSGMQVNFVYVDAKTYSHVLSVAPTL